MKKFELTTNTKIVFGKKLFQIKALVSFGNVEKGDLGGWIEKEENLSQDGNAWVSGNADYATIKGFGTYNRNTTFFKCKDGKVRVICGCFYGDLDEFRKQVKATRTGKVAEEYLMIADLMEKHFKED